MRGQPDSYQFCVYISTYLFVGDNGNDDEFFKRDWTAYTNGFGNPLLVMKNMVEPNANRIFCQKNLLKRKIVICKLIWNVN